MIRPISLGTRFGFALALGSGFCPLTPLLLEVPVLLEAACAVPLTADRSPLTAGPVEPVVVSDVPTACVDELVVLVFAADADFVPPPLHAAAANAIAIEKRIERFIFRR